MTLPSRACAPAQTRSGFVVGRGEITQDEPDERTARATISVTCAPLSVRAWLIYLLSKNRTKGARICGVRVNGYNVVDLFKAALCVRRVLVCLGM